MLLHVLPWRLVFVVFGAVGFIWAGAWFYFFRDEPADHAAVNQAERKLIESGRLADQPHRLDMQVLGRIVTDRNVVALCLMYFTQAYGFYFNITWLPTYLAKARGFSSTTLGILAGLPLCVSAVADVVGGWTSDRMIRAHGIRAGRCGLGGASLLVAGVSLIAGAATDHAVAAALLIALAGAGASFLLVPAWGTCVDIAGPHAGLVTATMNTAGQVGAFLSPIVLPLFLKKGAEDWSTPLYLAGASISPGRCAGCSSTRGDGSWPDGEWASQYGDRAVESRR